MGPKTREKSAHVVLDERDLLDHSPTTRCAWLFEATRALQPARVDAKRGEALPELVVQVARKLLALILLKAQDAAREQPSCRLAALLGRGEMPQGVGDRLELANGHRGKGLTAARSCRSTSPMKSTSLWSGRRERLMTQCIAASSTATKASASRKSPSRLVVASSSFAVGGCAEHRGPGAPVLQRNRIRQRACALPAGADPGRQPAPVSSQPCIRFLVADPQDRAAGLVANHQLQVAQAAHVAQGADSVFDRHLLEQGQELADARQVEAAFHLPQRVGPRARDAEDQQEHQACGRHRQCAAHDQAGELELGRRGASVARDYGCRLYGGLHTIRSRHASALARPIARAARIASSVARAGAC